MRNLDHDGEPALNRAIAELRARGTTVVLITQRTQILSVVDRILVLRDGMVERIGVRQARRDAPTETPGSGGVPVLQQARAGGAS